MVDLDEIDRGILHMLQEDARNNTPADIADQVGVAPNTVRNRMEALEDAGVIEGYTTVINYEEAGYQLRVTFVCTVSVSSRAEMAERVLDVTGVVRVIERLSGKSNLAVEVVGENGDDITTVATQLEELGCTIEDEWFIKGSRVQPFDHFGASEAGDE